MADFEKNNPQDVDTARKIGSLVLDTLEKSSDLSKQLLGAYRDINDALKMGVGLSEQQFNLSRQISNDAEKRGRILSALAEERKGLEDSLFEAQLRRGNYQKKEPALVRQITNDLERQLAINEQQTVELLRQGGAWGYITSNNKAYADTIGKSNDWLSKHLLIIKNYGKGIWLLSLGFSAFVAGIKLGISRFKELDTTAEKFRRDTGFTIDQMSKLRKEAEQINVEFVGLGIGIEEVYKSAKALTDVYGRITNLSKDTVESVALLAANLGVSEESSAAVLSTFQGLGGVSQEVAINMMATGATLSKNLGVSFSAVMKDIAGASGETLSMLGASPAALMKAAIAARAMGTDLNKIVASQRRMLDFTTSINDELGASALLGRSISFQKARQLAYEGKVEDAAKATLETVKAAGDFNKMNVYQREALAKAAGMDLQDLTKMMAAEQQRLDYRKSLTAEQLKELDSQEAELKALKDASNIGKEDLIRKNKELLQQQRMQGLVSRLGNAWKSLLISVGGILEPIITPVVETLIPAVQTVADWFGVIARWLKETNSLGATAAKWAIGLAAAFGAIAISWKTMSMVKGGLGMLGGKGGAGAMAQGLPGADKLGDAAGKLGGGIGKGIEMSMTAIANGVGAFGKPIVLRGALGIAAVGASIIPFAYAMKLMSGIKWDGVYEGLSVFALLAVTAMGLSFALPLLLAGSLGIAAVGASLIVFAGGAMAAGAAASVFGEGIKNSLDGFVKLSGLELAGSAAGIMAISAALATFGTGAAAAGLGAFVGNFLGGDPIKKLERLAAIGPNLMAVSDSLSGIKTALSGMETIATSVDALTESLVRFNEEMENVSTLKLAALGIMGAAAAPAPAAAPAAGTNADVVGRLDELITLMKSGGIAVNMDGKRVSSALAAGD